MADLKKFFTRKKKDAQGTKSETTVGGTVIQGGGSILPFHPSMWKRLTSFRGGVPFEKSAPLVFIALLALMAADLTSVAFRSAMLPTGSPPGKKQVFETNTFKALNDYSDILARNIFNSDG